MKITFTLSLDEAAAIIKLLGSVPTEQGAFPLWARLKAEAEAQVKDQQPIPKVPA